MSTDLLAGAFPVNPTGGNVNVLADVTGVQNDYTSGQTVVSPVTSNPTLLERWVVLGWSMRVRVAVFTPAGSPAPPYWARFGKLWGGFMPSASIQNQGAVAFPPDMSTFTVLWDGQFPIPVFSGSPATPTTPAFGLVALTYMLPSPIPLRPGAQIQMGLVMTPTLSSGSITLAVRECIYSIIYDNGKGQQ